MSEECSKCGANNWSGPKYQQSIFIRGITPFDNGVTQNECLVFNCLTCGALKVTNTKDKKC